MLAMKRIYAGRRLFHSSCLWHVKNLRPFLLADIGEGITECEVLKWSVKPNARVEAFDPLCEVQSDKASVEITSPFEGIVHDILVQEGEIAKVGQSLCVIEVEEEDSAALDATPNASQASNSSKESAQDIQREDAPSLSKEGKLAPNRHLHPLDPSNQPHTSETSSSTFAPAKDTLAAPSVRHFARQNGIHDLSAVHPGSGKDGRIEKKDVEAYLNGVNAQSSFSPGLTPPPSSDRILELGRTRWAMYKAMTKSLEIPHFGYSATLDVTALSTLLPTFNAYVPNKFNAPTPPKYPPSVSPYSILPSEGELTVDASRQYTRLTLLPLLLKTLSRAMLEWPVFRTSITSSNSDSKPTLTLRPHADISLALSTPTGLYTPTLRAVDLQSAYEIMGEVRRLQVLGRQIPSGLTVKEMPKTGGTITVSNVGAIGKGEWAAPLLVPGGGVAIVAIGRAKWVMREDDGEFGPQRRLELGVSWSADHRVVEGAEMAAFVEAWRAWVENPGRLVADGR